LQGTHKELPQTTSSRFNIWAKENNFGGWAWEKKASVLGGHGRRRESLSTAWENRRAGGAGVPFLESRWSRQGKGVQREPRPAQKTAALKGVANKLPLRRVSATNVSLVPKQPCSHLTTGGGQTTAQQCPTTNREAVIPMKTTTSQHSELARNPSLSKRGGGRKKQKTGI